MMSLSRTNRPQGQRPNHGGQPSLWAYQAIGLGCVALAFSLTSTQALAQAPDPSAEPLVITHYGDSHSSIPALPAELRDLVAKGAVTSPGFVDPDRRMPGATVSAAGPWKKHNWIYGDHKGPFGPGGLAWSIRRAEGRMALKLKGLPEREITVHALYSQHAQHPPFKLTAGDRVLARVDAPEEGPAEAGLGRVAVTVPPGTDKITLTVLSREAQRREVDFRFFGFVVQVEGAQVEYDAFGVIGATIRSPVRRAGKAAQDYLKWRKPGAVVLWYGSNSAYRKRLDHQAYGRQYYELLTRMRAQAPDAVCIAVGPPDLGRTGGACGDGGPVVALPDSYQPPAMRRVARGGGGGGGQARPARRDAGVDSQGRTLRRRPRAGQRRRGRRGAKRRATGRRRARGMSEGAAATPQSEATPPAHKLRGDAPSGDGVVCQGTGPIPDIIEVQREAAFEAGCAYFDTYAWMGGPGSMTRWRRARPPLAAGDLVHLTFAGYRAVAHGIHKALPELAAAGAAAPPSPLDGARTPAGAAKCPAGAHVDAQSGLCVNDDEAFGPFPETMAEQCEARGGAGCRSKRWELDLAVALRGKSACLPGTLLDPAIGYCVDARFAYGPFEADHVAHCKQIGAGAVCDSLRWPRAITPARQVPGSVQEAMVTSRRGAAPAVGNGFKPNEGSCKMTPKDLQMVWRSCAPHMDCYQAKEGGRMRRFLRLPAVGPVAIEAHLVTVADKLPGAWPSSGRQGIKEHYALSEAATGYVMRRTQRWAPAGEGGCEYGQGAVGNPLPVLAEAWYINMFWRKRPPPGTRMIVTNPANGRSVVAAAGYETGPGNHEVMAGVSEEIHHYLGTRHRSQLRVGFAEDQSLPYGPIRCQ